MGKKMPKQRHQVRLSASTYADARQSIALLQPRQQGLDSGSFGSGGKQAVCRYGLLTNQLKQSRSEKWASQGGGVTLNRSGVQ